MGFVNEFVSAEDVKKYGLEEIDKRYRKSHFQPMWTVNREKNIYLRYMSSGREETSDEQYWTFYWNGALLDVATKRRGEGVPGGNGLSIWGLVSLRLPMELEVRRAEILGDLREALTAFKDFGARSTTVDHEAKFDF